MRKLYVVGPEKGGYGRYILVADTGEYVASCIAYVAPAARNDFMSEHPRQDSWNRFGAYEIVVLGEDQMTRSELVALNKAWREGGQNQEPPHLL